MKHNLPWNVSGIPPEAREFARAAAAKEGISVGEWLTRRIFSEVAGSDTSAPDEAAVPAPRNAPLLAAGDEIAARLAPSESQAELGFRRIDETLSMLGRRLEDSERSQLEAQRAMSAAAREINAATRDQSLAFQHLTTRIDRVERQTDNGALRDAVRALHQGLSRLADQIAKTASESSGQISTLAHNVELLAGKIASAREESNLLRQDVEEKLQALSERLRQNEERIAATVELEERLRHTEDRLKQAEYRIASQPRLDDGLAQFDQRVNSSEQRMHDALGRHLAAIQANFQEIGVRLEQAEQRNAAGRAVEDMLRELNARLDAAEKRNSEAIVELAGSIGETAKRLESLETNNAFHLAISLPPPEPSPEISAEPPPEISARAVASIASERATFEVAPSAESPPLLRGDDFPPPQAAVPSPPMAAPVAASFLTPPSSPSTENYLAQARRAAQTAAGSETDRNLRPATHGRASVDSAPRRNRSVARTIAAAAALILVAAVSGLALLRSGTPRSEVAVLAPRGQAAGDSAAARVSQPAQSEASAGGTTDSASAASTGRSRTAATETGPAEPKAPTAAPRASERVASAVPSLMPPGAAAKVELGPQTSDIDTKAALALGLKFADGNGVPANDVEAARWLQKAAEGGEPVAQYRLGTLYEKGRGVDANPREAIRWYSEAAKRGNRKAMHNLAVAYADGAGTDKNFVEAARWFQAAAQLGLTDSQFNLAVLYERGLGVKVSLSEAYKWYAIAAAAGDAESKTRMAALGSQIRPSDRDAADRAAKAYRPQPLNVAANDGP